MGSGDETKLDDLYPPSRSPGEEPGEEANETSLVQQEMMGGHSHGLYTFDKWSVHSEHGQQIQEDKQGMVTIPKLSMTNTWSL